MVGLIVLKEPIVTLLFKRGAFDAETTRLTAQALLFYALGLWAFSAVRIVLSAFYALQDTKTPVRIATVAILANIVLGVILMHWLAHGGLALALSLSSMLNFGLLLRALRQRLGTLGWDDIWISIAKTLVCSTVMGIIVGVMARMVIPPDGGTLSVLFLGLFGCITIGIASYGLVSIFMKSAEVRTVWTIVRESVTK
jgi:putative peptidoglycan lipid II flippase